jgi:hypothetical protein
VFDDYARLIAEDDRKAQSMIDALVQKKVKAAIEAASRPKKDDQQFNEIDTKTLYDLINGIPSTESNEDPK